MPQPIPPPRSSGYTTTTKVPLYWAAWGPEGRDRLLVLHGGPGAHHDYLLPQMLHLAEKHELVFYDQRGGGQSKSDDREPVTWQTQVADLEAVIREFGLERPSIVGYSFGGMLALLYAIEAAKSPDKPKPARMALIDPAPLAIQYRKEFEAEFARRQSGMAIRALREELAASGLRESNPDEYRQRAFELAVAPYFADPGNARDLTPFKVTGRVQDSIWSSLGPDYDLIAQLHQMDFPVLFVHGRDDPIPWSSSSKGADAMAAELVLLDDCGHVPYVEQPGKLFAALDAFLAGTGARTHAPSND